MKKAIYLLALILGISGTAAAQSCGGGYYGGGTSYYNSIDAVGKVNIRKRGFIDRRWVVDARIINDRGGRLSLEYVFANGDVLTVMAKRRRGQGNHHQGFGHNDDPYVVGASNNYYYGSNAGPRRANGTFEVHCVRINGRTIANNCGTIRIQNGYGRFAKTFINIDMGRRGIWKGNADVFKGRRY